MDAKTPTKKVKSQDLDLEEVIDWTKIDTPVQHVGKAITLPGEPDDMPYDVAIETLQRIKQAENQVYDVSEIVVGLPWDAAVAVFKAMQEIYGVVLPSSMTSWFGKINPTFLSVKTGYRDTDIVQVPTGQFVLPGMDAPCHLMVLQQGVVVAGKVNKKDRARLTEIAVRARKILKTDSIYKGKAIRLLVNASGAINVNEQPEFFPVEGVRETDMIHNEVTQQIIETSILAPIKNTAACRKHKIPLKRGILLEGRYGTGKTLTARVTAKVAVDHGWTFVVLSNVRGLYTALDVASQYQPSVIFAEDIDRATQDREDSEPTNELINAMDGLIPPGAELMVVLTTNHVELIDRAMLRPGRLDAVISIEAPDAGTVERLIRHYGAGNLQEQVSLKKTGELMAGQIPATVAEVVKRAKLIMLTYDREWLVEADLVTAAESMKRHMSLLDETPPAKSPGDKLADAFSAIFDNTETGGIAKDLKEIRRMIREQTYGDE